MKYIFLLMILLSGINVRAVEDAVDFTQDPTDPNLLYSSTGNKVDTPSGGLTNAAPANPSGGTTNAAPANPSGGLTNAAPANPSGGVTKSSSLPELEKPTLSIAGIANWVIKVMNYVVFVIMTAALVMFLYGVFMLMFVGGTNEESRSKGKKFMLWGIVSLFVMISVWGLVNVLKTSVFGSGESFFPQFK